ncbi:MFS transporter [Streptomyces sp. WI04-05B]|uniref:MFS transporter n=1 Tax=Streptomyces TaxID=1883 RepID=UPI0029BE9198|nr:MULTISPECIES: MFS transporter [unclassified Streptomyces]MDX2541122.1 MFS transporter [Streptomyces sp. WI04-05B]MDX2585648.1 MFS transporter [Streptomyces sp. WI04-05A]MDX3752158.1 MFS transporter [Streptomyces sp. AK08-02]
MTTRNWSVVRVLRDRAAGLCLAGVVVSGFGTSALWLASGIWVKDLTGSDGLAALCLFAMWAPSLAGPLLGTLADRSLRKPLLIWTNLTLATLLTALFTVDSADRVWILFAVLFVYGAVGVVQDAAEPALVATVVDPTLLGDFNGLRMTANEGMKLVAPPAGAGLYAAYGGPSVALLDAVTFVLATLLYACLRVHESPPQPPVTGLRARTAEGAVFLWRHDRLRPLVLAGGTTMLLSGLSAATLYAVVEGLGHSPAYAGPLYVLQGAGSVAVGLASGPLLRRLGERGFAAYGIVLTGAAMALRAVPADLAVLGSGVAAGMGLPCVLIAGLTAVQRETPEELLGRTAATANTLMFAPTAIGLAVGAALVELVDHRVLLPLYALALLLTAVPLFQRRASASRTASRSPSDANPA